MCSSAGSPISSVDEPSCRLLGPDGRFKVPCLGNDERSVGACVRHLCGPIASSPHHGGCTTKAPVEFHWPVAA